jgi:cytochrome c-type biogenesis protein CcmH
MSARVVPVAAAVLLAALLALAMLWPAPEPTGPDAADAIAAGLRCPDCQGLSVADSPSQAAVEIRRQIDAMLAEGATADEVRAHFVARYGEWILLAPSAGWVWWLPFVALAVGVAALVGWLRGGGGPRSRTEAPVVSDAARARAREEAEALDA